MNFTPHRALRARSWACFAILTMLLAGCAGNGPTTRAVSPEVRQAIAPTGKLRVGVYAGSPSSMIRDAATGEIRGVSVDLGKELARRLGVPFETVEFARVAEVIEGLRSGAVDMTVTNATAERARLVDFTPPFLGMELGYLVPAGSPISMIAEVDRPGIRIGVSQGSTSQGVLTRELKHAQVVTAPTIKGAIDMLSRRQVDAFATNKGILFEMSDALPASRVLDGRWGLEHMAIGAPKGREAGAAYLRQFAEDVSSEGLVARASERAGLRGTIRIESR